MSGLTINRRGCKLILKCPESPHEYHVNDLRAQESKIAALIGLMVMIIGTAIILILLWDYIWQSGLYGAFGLILIIGIPGSVYMIINKNDQSRVNSFNRS